MNIHTRKLETEISDSDVNEALSVLKKWRDQGGKLDLSDKNLIPPEVASLWMHYPELTDTYSDDFKLDGEYKALVNNSLSFIAILPKITSSTPDSKIESKVSRFLTPPPN